ncbi:MAG: aspartate--tRNA ligase, partial [Paracoccaceae bacterium]
MHAYRSHTCVDLTAANVGDTVRLSGWVHRRRDHGGVIFIDLRDHYGITQILCDPDSPVFTQVEKLRAEYCIRIDGIVKARAPDLVNKKLPTGEIEVYIRDMEVLGAVKGDLPLQVFGDQEYPEETRLTYRYLDLRREAMQRNITLRSDVVASMRKRMWDKGFREYQTPIITASSPEGARDFLVPSRLHPGKFYALPQAPQQFKQLIMVSGFDRYFQIAPCFRDEDPRADRSPTDFYQLDMEMSFVEQQDVFDTIQPVIQSVFEEYAEGAAVDKTWPQISYRDAALWYGTDKPDLRNPIRMQDTSEHFRGSGFYTFTKLLEQEGTEVRAIPAPTGGSRKFCDRMNAFAQKEGLPGMGYIFWRERDRERSELEKYLDEQPIKRAYLGERELDPAEIIFALERFLEKQQDDALEKINEQLKNGNLEQADFLQSAYFGPHEAAGPLAKNIGPERTEKIRQQLGLGVGDAAFFLGGKPSAFERVASKARDVIGEELELTEANRFAFAWIVDFPMYEADETTGRVDFSHNPFSMPQG